MAGRYPKPSHFRGHPVSELVSRLRHPGGRDRRQRPDPVPEDAALPQFIVNRRKMQAEHLETIRRLFNGQVRALVPLFDQEIQGVGGLSRLAENLFT